MDSIIFHTELLALEEGLLRYAISLSADVEEAKDLVQETFYKALQSQKDFQDQDHFKAWVYTILKNTFINNYRRKTRRSTIFNTDVHEYILNNQSSRLSPENNMDEREIMQSIQDLEPDYRIPFQMHTCGYKYQEIADKLGLKLGTVKSRIFFSRQKLMAALPEHAATWE